MSFQLVFFCEVSFNGAQMQHFCNAFFLHVGVYLRIFVAETANEK